MDGLDTAGFRLKADLADSVGKADTQGIPEADFLDILALARVGSLALAEQG